MPTLILDITLYMKTENYLHENKKNVTDQLHAYNTLKHNYITS